jgi:fermentation-respiration switch protein FrsA (DUF1100 family)
VTAIARFDRRVLAALLFAGAASLARAAEPTASKVSETEWSPWERWRVSRADAPPLDVYLAHDAVKRPLVIMVQGSDCSPLFQIREQGGKKRYRTSLIFADMAKSKGQAEHLAGVERRGLESFAVEASTVCAPGHGGISKEERVRDTADAAIALSKLPWAGPILLAGHSEGADVVSGTARALAGKVDVAGVGFFSGGGPSQFFDEVVAARRAGDAKAAQRSFEDLLNITSRSPMEGYRGWPTERWISYAVDSSALDDLRRTNAPVFIAQGGRDENSPIESADLLAVELLRDRRRLVKYVILPGADHNLVDSDGADRSDEVFVEFVRWSLDPLKTREVRTLDPAPQRVDRPN